MLRLVRVFTSLLSILLLSATASAQIIILPPHPTEPRVPRPIPISESYKIKSVDVQTTIKDQIAQVQCSQTFQNTGSTTLETTFLFPLPDDAAISGLTLIVDGKELPGKLLKKEEARRIYESIVRSRRDPALLEYMGLGLFQTSVFPIPPQAERRVEIRYTQLLKRSSGLVDFSLPLGHIKHVDKPIETLTATIRIEASESLKSIYSPSHQIQIDRIGDKNAVCRINLSNVQGPDDFRLLYGVQNGMIGMHVMSYWPDEKEDGYFIALANPEFNQTSEMVINKSVICIIDRSGSMSGVKIEQAKGALKYVIERLRPGDTFNIVAYDSAVESFRPELQKADEASLQAARLFVDGIFAGGSTNIEGGLKTGLSMLTDKTRPNYVLFFTDGLPTVGEQNELKLAELAKETNLVQARMFNFGVGFDVNSRLLDRLSRNGKGQSVYVRPNENIEASVANLYQRIGSPVMTDLSLHFEFTNSVPEGTVTVNRLYPKELGDLFQGDQLVIVGRYKIGSDARVTLHGKVGAEQKTFVFPTSFARQSSDASMSFVERLWATRRVGEIIDELDLKGQNQELIDELVQLSIKHGIITPYTSFLADETTTLAAARENREHTRRYLAEELEKADGKDGFRQRAGKLALQTAPNAPAGAGGRTYGFDNLSEAEQKQADNVRNVGAKTFYRKKNQWRDASVTEDQEKNAIRVKQFSDEYFELANANGRELSKYLAFEEPLLVNLGEVTYQIDPVDGE